MKEIKITEKTTKKSLIDYLKSVKVKDKNLAERISYAVKMFSKDQTKVMKNDLFDLVQEVMSVLTPAPVEASLKPKKKSGLTKVHKSDEVGEEASASDDDEEDEDEAPVEKKTGKKSSLKKSNKVVVETAPPMSNVGVDCLPHAKRFPEEIDHPELGKIVACTGAYTTYAEVLKALEQNKTLYFACYWTKRHIREYRYAELYAVNPETVKGGFDYDLDIAMAVLPCETVERVFAMSRITEALYRFDGHDFEPVEDVDLQTKEKFMIRVTGGTEFEVYRPADEEVVTID